MSRRLQHVLLTAALAVAVAPGCSDIEPERELQPGTLRVGVLADRDPSGDDPEALIAAGAAVAEEEINNAGGIGGVVRIRLVLGRPDGSAGSYRAAVRGLVRRGVRALLLPCGARLGEVGAPVAEADVVALAPCAGPQTPLPAGAVRTGVGLDHPLLEEDPVPGGELDEFYERFKALFGYRPPSSVAALGYDAVKVLEAAVDIAESPRPVFVEQELREGLEVGSAFGTIRYKEGSSAPTFEFRGVGGG